MDRNARLLLALVVSISSLAAHAGGTGSGSTSASYSLQRASLSSGAEASSSASFVLTPTIGQEMTIGTSASPRFVLQSGFWSELGSGLVPVLLTVAPGTLPDEVDLIWSGNNDPYDVFSSVDCGAVFDGLTGTTSGNQLTGVETAPGGLTCFNVLATAPGPSIFP